MLVQADASKKDPILAFLKSEPEFNLFMIGDILNYGFDSDFQKIYINNELNQVVLIFHDTMLIYATNQLDIKEIVELFHQHQCTQIMGKAKLTEELIEELGLDYVRILSTFYKSEEKIAIPNNRCRVAKVEDVEKILDGLCATEELKHMYHNRDAQQKMITKRILNNEGIHVFIENNGKIISHINSTATTSSGCLIGGLFTLDEYRRQGLATECLKTLCASLGEKGIVPCAFTNNEIVKAVLVKNGFKAIGTWSIIGRK